MLSIFSKCLLLLNVLLFCCLNITLHYSHFDFLTNSSCLNSSQLHSFCNFSHYKNTRSTFSIKHCTNLLLSINSFWKMSNVLLRCAMTLVFSCSLSLVTFLLLLRLKFYFHFLLFCLCFLFVTTFN